jgi:hypothetical protein
MQSAIPEYGRICRGNLASDSFCGGVRITGSVSLSVAAPYFPYLYGMALGLALLCLVLLGLFIRSVASLFGIKPPAVEQVKAVNL